MDEERIYNVKDFGASGDGKNNDTAAVQRTIELCSKSMGGTVYFPCGIYRVGTIFLRSNTRVYLENGAVLTGSKQIEDYSKNTYKQMYDYHSYMDSCLIYAEGEQNISICGKGSINGNGNSFPNRFDDQRPVVMRLVDCHHINIEGIAVFNPATWVFSFIRCSHLSVNSLCIKSTTNTNGNALIFDACTSVTVSECQIETSDDSLCIQSSGAPCRGIAIRNCTISSTQWSAIRIGFLSKGSIEDITVTDCIMYDVQCSGIKIQSVEGGTIKNLLFKNIIMKNVSRPVFITFNHFRLGVDSDYNIPETGGIYNISFLGLIIDNKDVTSLNAGCIITGISNFEICNIHFADINYVMPDICTDTFSGFDYEVDLKDKRPEINEFGTYLPASAFFIQNVNGISFKDIKLMCTTGDIRPFFLCKNVKNIKTNNVMFYKNIS